jgi:hypothetical protein
MQIFNIQVSDYLGFTSKISDGRMLITVAESRTQYFTGQSLCHLLDVHAKVYTHENNGLFCREADERMDTCLL